MKAFVTGATGFIGSHLVESLVNRGYHVTCTARETSDLRWLQPLLKERLPAIQLVTADLRDSESLVSSLHNVNLVFHLAGLTKARNADAYDEANAVATERLIQACLAANGNLVRFLYCSSLAASGPSLDGSEISEDITPHPVTDYGRSKLKGELVTKKYANQLPTTIIRPPAVYGPRDADIFLFFKCVKRGIMPLIGNTQRKLSLVHVKDLIEGICTSATADCAVGETYFLTDGLIHSWLDVAEAIASGLGTYPLKLRVPFVLLDMVSVFTETAAKLTHRSAVLNRQKMIDLKQPFWICDTRKAVKQIKYHPVYPLEVGIEETAIWYLENGWL